MDIREVQTPDGTRWQCAEAMIKPADDKSSPSGREERDLVTVVCTPTGGAQSVRIELEVDWKASVPDEELSRAIEENRE
jgi:hypothetical protein